MAREKNASKEQRGTETALIKPLYAFFLATLYRAAPQHGTPGGDLSYLIALVQVWWRDQVTVIIITFCSLQNNCCFCGCLFSSSRVPRIN